MSIFWKQSMIDFLQASFKKFVQSMQGFPEDFFLRNVVINPKGNFSSNPWWKLSSDSWEDFIRDFVKESCAKQNYYGFLKKSLKRFLRNSWRNCLMIIFKIFLKIRKSLKRNTDFLDFQRIISRNPMTNCWITIKNL